MKPNELYLCFLIRLRNKEWIMSEIVLNKYIRMFDLLDLEAKLELLARLSENVNRSFKSPRDDKHALLESLSGSWEDVDDSIVDEIYSSRTTSDKGIDFE
jgi:hypothetical protein